MKVIQWRKAWYLLSGLLVSASLIACIAFGWKLSIDFTGGSVLEVAYTEQNPGADAVRAALISLALEDAVVQTVGEKGILLRSALLSEEQHQSVVESLSTLGALEERRFDAVGPSIGRELARRAAWALVLVVLMIVAYVAWAFRKVGGEVRAWKYGVLTVVAGVHDVLIPLGVFAVLGHVYGTSIGTAFVAAILTVLGYSVNDTIVIFDRVRERAHVKQSQEQFESIVERAVRETWKRSVNTTVTTLLALAAILIFGGASTREFALALFIGIATGAYSSIFLAAPLLVTWEKWDRRGER